MITLQVYVLKQDALICDHLRTWLNKQVGTQTTHVCDCGEGVSAPCMRISKCVWGGWVVA